MEHMQQEPSSGLGQSKEPIQDQHCFACGQQLGKGQHRQLELPQGGTVCRQQVSTGAFGPRGRPPSWQRRRAAKQQAAAHAHLAEPLQQAAARARLREPLQAPCVRPPTPLQQRQQTEEGAPASVLPTASFYLVHQHAHRPSEPRQGQSRHCVQQLAARPGCSIGEALGVQPTAQQLAASMPPRSPSALAPGDSQGVQRGMEELLPVTAVAASAAAGGSDVGTPAGNALAPLWGSGVGTSAICALAPLGGSDIGTGAGASSVAEDAETDLVVGASDDELFTQVGLACHLWQALCTAVWAEFQLSLFLVAGASDSQLFTQVGFARRLCQALSTAVWADFQGLWMRVPKKRESSSTASAPLHVVRRPRQKFNQWHINAQPSCTASHWSNSIPKDMQLESCLRFCLVSALMARQSPYSLLVSFIFRSVARGRAL